ncbi:MAG: hypothetical protein RL748_1532 [Pseudomonadota bacterium]|jgi:glycerol transport system ATP-binding protein
MARIEFKNLGHAYPGSKAYALEPMSMTWDDGGAYALLGPSGCGKSTLLNIISGLLLPSDGQVLFDGRDVTRLPTRERNIAQVFQFPVLYDTMSVFDNLAFPLRNRNMPEPQVRQRVHEVAEMLELSKDLNLRASGLAADAKQKISLGRGLVRKDVAAILFDEPLTVIDPHMKWQLRQKLKQIHQHLKLTLIYVTHDQVEALTFADEVVLMTDGKVVQKGVPEALFERPDHRFVGYFIGSPGMNFFPLQLASDARGTVLLGGERLPVPDAIWHSLQAAASNGAGNKADNAARLELGIRPEFVQLAQVGSEGSVPANVVRVQALGTCQLVTAMVGEHVVKAKLEPTQAVALGPQAVRLLSPQTSFFCNDERIGR